MKISKPEADLIRESDRGAVIVGAAILEDTLTELLRTVFTANKIPKKQMERLFDLNGPLSNFASKALICFGFGLISKSVFDDLNGIRALRNKFAHTSEVVDFLDEHVVASVMSLNCVIKEKEKFKGKRFSLAAGSTLTDMEIANRGYLKYAKTVFVLGVKQLQIDIMKFHLKAISSRYLKEISKNVQA